MIAGSEGAGARKKPRVAAEGDNDTPTVPAAKVQELARRPVSPRKGAMIRTRWPYMDW